MLCRFCGDPVDPFRCCGTWVLEECRADHNEVSHGLIRNHNIHLCGNHHAKLNSIDNDPDAYRRASDDAALYA